MGKSTTGHERISRAEKMAQAVQLRKMGFTFHEISERMGITPGYANKLVKAALAEYAQITDDETDGLRSLMAARLDNVMRGIWAKVVTGNLGAIDRMVKIEEQRAKLYGLYAPNKVQHGGIPDGVPIGVQQVSILDGIDIGSLTKEQLDALESAVATLESLRTNPGGTGEPQP